MSTVYESEEYIELTKQLETLISEETIIHKKINVLMDKMQSLVSQYEKEKDTVDNIHDKTVLKQVINFLNEKLTKREKYIMNRRYGLDGKKPQTQQELADKLGISRSYVSRIETKVQRMLSKNIKY